MFFNRISFALFTLTLFYKGIVFYVNKIFSIFIFRDKIKEINSFEIRSHNFNNKIFGGYCTFNYNFNYNLL